GRTQEIQRLIGRSLRAVIDLNALGERAIVIDCDVLQADGGTRTASITGGYVALAAACKRLVEVGLLAQSPLHGSVAAVSVGVLAGEVLLDLAYVEDSRAEVDMNVVATGSGRLVEVQGTAEGGTFDRKTLDQLLDVALLGIGELGAIQARALEAWTGSSSRRGTRACSPSCASSWRKRAGRSRSRHSTRIPRWVTSTSPARRSRRTRARRRSGRRARRSSSRSARTPASRSTR